MNTGQAAIRQAAREFVADNIIPHAEYYDKTGDFHAYLLEAARPTGIFAMAVPTEYGGLGYSPLTQALVLEEWGYGCAAMGTTLSASILSMEAVLIAGNDDQKRRFCKPMLDAGISAFALTEPAAGSDVSADVATAVKSGNDYILNGPKCWITNGGVASIYVVFAATDPARGAKGLSAIRRCCLPPARYRSCLRPRNQVPSSRCSRGRIQSESWCRRSISGSHRRCG
jgi:alkylation response protein AidB-like acyl-CoA dehydrogenase